MRRTYYTVAEKLRAEPHTRRTTIERLKAFESTFARLKAENANARKRAGIFSRFIGFVRKAVLDDLRRV
jgi:hypothetical protein